MWASPILLVGKKDGSMRMYINYRCLNEVTGVDQYPMPRVNDLLDKLGGAMVTGRLLSKRSRDHKQASSHYLDYTSAKSCHLVPVGPQLRSKG